VSIKPQSEGLRSQSASILAFVVHTITSFSPDLSALADAVLAAPAKTGPLNNVTDGWLLFPRA
jgi:hypothetical protein